MVFDSHNHCPHILDAILNPTVTKKKKEDFEVNEHNNESMQTAKKTPKPEIDELMISSIIVVEDEISEEVVPEEPNKGHSLTSMQ